MTRTKPERMHSEAVHKKRLLGISRYAGYPGPWYSEGKGRVVNCGRGKRSKYLKRLGNRRIRRTLCFIPSGGSYKKVFDYWWELT